MGEYHKENWADILLPEGNKEINLSTGGEETMQTIEKRFSCELKDFLETDRSFTATASTESVDRDGDILRANGWKLKNYRKNPIVLWAHDAFSLPIARAQDIKTEDGKLIFTPKFATAEMNPLAEQVYQMYKTGFLRAFSVRFDPIEWKEIEPEEDKSAEFMRRGREYKAMELLEISAVCVPANAEALKSPAMHDLLIKSYITENMRLFPNSQDIKELAQAPLSVNNIFDFREELKQKYERLEELQRAKEKRITESEIDEQIKMLESELNQEIAIQTLKCDLDEIQAGITGLLKK